MVYFPECLGVWDFFHFRDILPCVEGVLKNSDRMSTARYADWRADLDASRDLSDLDKQSYGFVLGWFESWRLRKGLRAERPTAVAFWKEQVILETEIEPQMDADSRR